MATITKSGLEVVAKTLCITKPVEPIYTTPVGVFNWEDAEKYNQQIEQWQDMVLQFCLDLSANNARFNKVKFLKAANYDS